MTQEQLIILELANERDALQIERDEARIAIDVFCRKLDEYEVRLKIRKKSQRCPSCGELKIEERVYCSNCGKFLRPG